jgi:hypothetical protein
MCFLFNKEFLLRVQFFKGGKGYEENGRETA